MADAAPTYALKYQARVLVALGADAISSQFLVGTTALREENEVSRAPPRMIRPQSPA
jgi:hypothetical protein